jgi:hypothetical protein
MMLKMPVAWHHSGVKNDNESKLNGWERKRIAGRGTMKIHHVVELMAVAVSISMVSVSEMHSDHIPKGGIHSGKALNPNTEWLREAKWGFFTHYLPHMPSADVPEDMTAEKWNRKVDSFQVKRLADQLSELKAPYFFITIGQKGGYYCSPNET